ncbi:MAG: hypothetical protein AMXMBFR84_28700 [Candidatus Hydrogenedentota bacterium]
MESYDAIVENGFRLARIRPLSTFSIDVDTASYSNTRRFLEGGQLPPIDAIRVEEFINYFTYAYPPATQDKPISAIIETAQCPWNETTRLVRIGLKAKDVPEGERPKSNLVFLIDVSGSMADFNKLPLVKRSLQAMVQHLGDDDRIAIAVYAGHSGVALSSERCTEDNKPRILKTIDNLDAGGSTHGSEGIQTAYEIAANNFKENGVNRVILATDGDFNVGVTDKDALARLIEEKAKTGVFLSVLGFGMGNIKDSTLEKLADKGNGHYAYIDTFNEARKVLIEEMGATLVAVAKDVKIQVEFNPAKVEAYRLIGYENRAIADEDFKDDTKDAGEMGAGHAVTALYEIAAPGSTIKMPDVDPLKYQPTELSSHEWSGELLTLKVRYKDPKADTSQELVWPVLDETLEFESASEDFRWAAAVASLGMILRESPYVGTFTCDDVIRIAQHARGADSNGYRAEFIQIAFAAKSLKPE